MDLNYTYVITVYFLAISHIKTLPFHVSIYEVVQEISLPSVFMNGFLSGMCLTPLKPQLTIHTVHCAQFSFITVTITNT